MSKHLYKHDEKYIKTDKWLSVNSAYNVYNVSLQSNNILYGTLTADRTSGFYNDEIYMTATPNDNYVFDHYTVDGGTIANNNFIFSSNDATARAYFTRATDLPYYYALYNTADNIIASAKVNSGYYDRSFSTWSSNLTSTLDLIRSTRRLEIKYDNMKTGFKTFNGCSSLIFAPNKPVFNKLISANNMFYDVKHVAIPENSFENLEYGIEMFYNAENIVFPKSACFNKLINANGMFRNINAYSAKIPDDSFNNVISANNMFRTCTNFIFPDKPCFNNLVNADSMFYYFSNTSIENTKIPNSSFNNLSGVITNMFGNCCAVSAIGDYCFNGLTAANSIFSRTYNLQEIGDNSFNNLISANGTFNYTGPITSIGMHSFVNLKSAYGMFNDSNIKNISLNYGLFNNLEYAPYMFANCTSLSSNIQSLCDYLINKYPSTYKTAFKYMFGSCKSIGDRSISSNSIYSSFFRS